MKKSNDLAPPIALERPELFLHEKLNDWMETFAKAGICVVICDKTDAGKLIKNSAAADFFKRNPLPENAQRSCNWLNAFAEKKEENIWVWRLRPAEPPAISVHLTKREHTIYELLKKGYSNLEISNHLNINQRTVEKHVENVLKKTKSTRNALISTS